MEEYNKTIEYIKFRYLLVTASANADMNTKKIIQYYNDIGIKNENEQYNNLSDEEKNNVIRPTDMILAIDNYKINICNTDVEGVKDIKDIKDIDDVKNVKGIEYKAVLMSLIPLVVGIITGILISTQTH